MNAVHVLDHFHTAKLPKDAVNLVRRRAAKRLRERRRDLAKGTLTDSDKDSELSVELHVHDQKAAYPSSKVVPDLRLKR